MGDATDQTQGLIVDDEYMVFDPDLELEWEIGIDREVVFEPAVTLSVITATSGRDTLTRTLASLAPQLRDGDELLVVRRDNVPWGNATRDEAIKRAVGTHLWWVDDDDVATPDAFETIRRHVATDPGTVHIFKMEMPSGVILHPDRIFRVGLVSGGTCVVPNTPDKLGTWLHDERLWNNTPGEAGDFHFLSGTLELLGRDPVFHDDVIARIRP